MPKVKLPKALACRRCGYNWIPRKAVVKICPRCKHPKWYIDVAERTSPPA